MSANDSAGRIPRTTFLASTITLFVVALVSVCARLFIRIHYQKTFSVDDGFILAGVACLICSFGLLFVFIDGMYLAEALLTNDPDLDTTGSGNWIMEVFNFQKFVTICLILLWTGICCVKFTFLFLFRKLVDRIRWMTIYWWVITCFCFVVWLYGVSSYITPCPYFYTSSSLECSQGPDLARAIKTSSVQMSMDVLSDFLILVIPSRLIWKIQIQWTQKLALSLTLCLSLVMIAMTLVRASGLIYEDVMDISWETYWNFLATEVGIILTSITAFRAFFVVQATKKPFGTSHNSWYSYSKRILQQAVRPWTWRSRSSNGAMSGSSGSSKAERVDEFQELVDIPRPQMTGIRTFIKGSGRSTLGMSQIMASKVYEEDTDARRAASPLRKPERIVVQHEFSIV